ncbi:hypothetical protein [Methylomonas koyamae]|uniref:hypothetical protein n=1 Tax=Methylomonas koyamae TaxID=702114 RepID=UPI0028731F77|nr:hypothetical protein [Methylomonas koyamae]WNB75157.1 hypothetical protein RI210_18005 [Methylomonas koyamae]
MRQWFAQQANLGVSEISRLEVLGYHRLTETDKRDFRRMFNTLMVYPISSVVIDSAIHLRQQRKISVGDANRRDSIGKPSNVSDPKHPGFRLGGGIEGGQPVIGLGY